LLIVLPARGRFRTHHTLPAWETDMTEPNGGPSRRPLAVYAVIDRKDGAKPAIWLKVGAAFSNRDGSLTLLLDAFPATTNRLQVREQRPFDETRNGSAIARPASGEEAHP
jgi:hypothetical protein